MSFPKYPSYKPSGVEWLGDVPAHWAAVRLRQLGRLLKGSGGSKEDIVNEGVPCVRYGDLYTTHRDFIVSARTRVSTERAVDYVPLKHGDVLFAGSGETFEEIGKSAVNLIDGEAVCGGDLIILRPDTPVHPRFLGYACDSSNAATQKAMMGRGTTVKHIYPDELRHLALCVPPPDEQIAIAAFLDRETAKIDALVAEQERLIELLKEKRQAVAFHAIAKGLNPAAPRKRSGIEWLGDIPAHWRMMRLKHLSPAMTVGVVVNPSSYVSEEGLPFIYGGDIREGVIDWAQARRIGEEASFSQPKTRLSTGDILTVRVGAPGVTAVVPAECEGGNCASVMHIRRGAFDSAWLCYAMNTRVVRYQVEVVQYGAAQEQFNIGHAVDFWVPTPPGDEQQAIAAHLGRVTESIDRLSTEAEQAVCLLRERRAALISAAVTGQIDLRRLN